MRGSFILGVLGGIITIIVGVIVIFVGAFVKAFVGSAPGLEYLSALSFIGGIMGIVGGAWGKKGGGILMIIGSIFAIIGASYFGILGFVLLIVGGVLAFKEKETITVNDENHQQKKSALDILMERYAKGEITKEQFDEMKKRLDELEK